MEVLTQIQQLESLLEQYKERIDKNNNSTNTAASNNNNNNNPNSNTNSNNNNTPVKLNVGGTFFQTTRATLQLLLANCKDPLPSTSSEDESLFIDRDPTHFRYILNYVRDKGKVKLSFPNNTRT